MQKFHDSSQIAWFNRRIPSWPIWVFELPSLWQPCLFVKLPWSLWPSANRQWRRKGCVSGIGSFAGLKTDRTEVWFGGIWLHVLAPEGSWEPAVGNPLEIQRFLFEESPSFSGSMELWWPINDLINGELLFFHPFFKWTVISTGNKLLVFQHPTKQITNQFLEAFLLGFITSWALFALLLLVPLVQKHDKHVGTNRSKKAESFPPYFGLPKA